MLHFHPSPPLALGLEWELQLIDPESQDLSPVADTVCADFSDAAMASGWSQNQLVLRTPLCPDMAALRRQLPALQQALLVSCRHRGISVCGGGTHPIHQWLRARAPGSVAEDDALRRFGFLAKLGEVFGLRIRLGCMNGDEALGLASHLMRYAPHFTAYAAASPFHSGVDTGFDCIRLCLLAAFPLSGPMPYVRDWDAYAHGYAHLQELGIIRSSADILWDIRPDPEAGTVDVRLCDSPLSVDDALDLAALAQTIAHWHLHQWQQTVPAELHRAYQHNRFQACHYGLAAHIVDVHTSTPVLLMDDFSPLLEGLEKSAKTLGTEPELARVRRRIAAGQNPAQWLRHSAREGGDLHALVAKQVTAFGRAAGLGTEAA